MVAVVITPSDITALPSTEFANVVPSLIQRHIDTAAANINKRRWAATYDAGVLNLAAHTLAMELRGSKGPGGPVASESAGPVSRSYAVTASNDALDSTTYGREYKRLRASIVRNPLVI